MATITLLSVNQARPGFVLNYMGSTPVCGPCKFRNACLTLDVGHRYQVKAVRRVKHPCALQESEACVVEMETVPRTIVVDSVGTVEGATVDVARYSCYHLDCPRWEDCAGPSIVGRSKFTIENIVEETVCLAGRRIKVVQAR
jgi:hypothetical protein